MNIFHKDMGSFILTPIFIPTSEILALPPNFATVMNNGGKVKLEPKKKGYQLQGFRCDDTIIDSIYSYETCGERTWLCRLNVEFLTSDCRAFDNYKKDFMGEMVPKAIDCIALFPSDKGYIVIGAWPAQFKFGKKIIPYPDGIVHIELLYYQPLPEIIYEGSVAVTECNADEIMVKFKDLITI